MHASKDSMWQLLCKLFWVFLPTKQALKKPKKNSACGRLTAPATLRLKKKTFLHRPRNPRTPCPALTYRPVTPWVGRSIYLCFGKRGTGEGVFFYHCRPKFTHHGTVPTGTRTRSRGTRRWGVELPTWSFPQPGASNRANSTSTTQGLFITCI
jgi:hypothetical protein